MTERTAHPPRARRGSSPEPFREDANPWPHALAVFAIGVPLLLASLSLFFLLFTQTEPPPKNEAPVSVQVQPPAPPRPVLPPPPRPPVKRVIPLPVKASPPPPILAEKVPPPDTQRVPPPPALSSASADSASLIGNTSAYVISKPLPEIPAEFRGKPMDISITVKFTVGPDGRAKAELVSSSPDPKLNQWFLETFRRWKFYPAIRNNEGVTSELLITVPVKVY